MTTPVVVIGIGNTYRSDDGVGLAVADKLAQSAPPGVRVHAGVTDLSALLDAWAGAELGVVVDATVSSGAVPGRIRRFTSDAVAAARTTSSHGLDVARALELGEARGTRKRPTWSDPLLEALFSRGLRHEHNYLSRLS